MLKLINPLNLLLTSVLLLMCVNSQAAINVAVELNPDPVAPNEIIRTAITVGNTGVNVSGSITLQLPYPEHLSGLSNVLISNAGVCPGSSCTTAELVTWTIGNLAPGTSITVTLPPIVNSGTADATQISFAAEVFEDAVSVATANQSVLVQSSSVFDIAVDEDLNPVAPGQSLTYAITYANRHTVSTTNTQLSFPLPAGVSFVSASGGGTLNGNMVEWDLQILPAKKAGFQTVTVTVDPGVVLGSILAMDAATITGQANLLDHSARARATTRVQNNTPMTLAMELNPNPVQPNEVIQSAITVGNVSDTPLFGVTLQLRYPEHLLGLSNALISNNGSCAGSSCDTAEFITWDLGNLASGASITVTLPPVVNALTLDGSLITFEAKVFEDNGSSVLASQSVAVQSDSVFDMAVDEDLNPVAPGQSLTYVLTYANRGAVATTNTQLRFPLPTGVSFISASSGGTLNDNVVEWDLQSLPATKAGRQTVKVNVNPGVSLGSFLQVDAVSITGQANVIDHTARARVITRVENNNPIALTMELNPHPVQPNEAIQSAVTVGNSSGATLLGVTLQLRYPEHLLGLANTLISNTGSCAGSSCTRSEFITWNLGNIAAGESITVSLPPVVSNVTPDGTMIAFTAKVSEDNGNSAIISRNVAVQADSVFDIAVDEDVNPVAANQMLTYIITYANRGTLSTTDTRLSFPLPNGVSFVSASEDGRFNGEAVEWDLQDFAAQKGGRQTVTVEVNAGVAAGSVLTGDAATITGQANLLEHTAHAQASTRVEENVPLALAITVAPNPATANASLQSVLSVDNTSDSTLLGVTLQLRFPEHLLGLNNALISGGGLCSGNTCTTTEFITWTLDNMAPGANIMVDLPPVISPLTINGTLITFIADIKEDNGRRVNASSTVLVSEFDFVPAPLQPSLLLADVDGNGQSDALTDGLLIIRFLFGFSGTTLTDSAVAGNATRTDPAEIFAYLTSITASLDVDGNGTPDALTDGLLVIRYLFGFRGETLIADAIGAGASRTTAAEIEDFLKNF